MRILLLTFYYEPDLCAGSFRAAALVRALGPLISVGSHIDVLTTMPNRYSNFRADAFEVEKRENIYVRRIPLPSHRSGMLDQSHAFLAYARGVYMHARSQKYDLVIATSSRLMTAVLGAYIARRQKAPLYLDIRDIFVDTIQDVFPRCLAQPMGRVFSALERYAVQYASKVNLVSRGFEHFFLERYPKQHFAFFPNGVDDQFVVSAPQKVYEGVAMPPYSVLYAGNLGEGQGLHAILPRLASAMRGLVKFTVIGDGGRKAILKKSLQEAGVDNVMLRDPVGRSDLIRAYLEADVLFLHLNDYDAFKKVLPSKLFEYAAVGKPIWAGVAGYAAEFITQEIENAVVFPPCDDVAAASVFQALKIQSTPRPDFIRKYERHTIMRSLATDIISIGLGGQR